MRGILKPVLNEHKIDVYIGGREHQSQILRDPSENTVYLISGSMADMRGENEKHDQPFRLWKNAKSVGFLELEF